VTEFVSGDPSASSLDPVAGHLFGWCDCDCRLFLFACHGALPRIARRRFESPSLFATAASRSRRQSRPKAITNPVLSAATLPEINDLLVGDCLPAAVPRLPFHLSPSLSIKSHRLLRA